MKFEWASPVVAGFHVIVARQWSFLAWCVAALACTGASLAAALGVAGGLSGGPDAVRRVLLLTVVGMAILGSPIVCAIYRAVLRPEESRFAYLRLGGVELRMIGILAPFACAWALLSILGAAAGPWKLAVFVAELLALSPLTLVAPVVFDRRRYDLGYALGLGRRYYWELVGLNVLSFVCFAIIELLVKVAWLPFMRASADDWIGLSEGRKDPLFLVQMLVAFAVVWLAYVASTVIVLAPAAAAYRWLAGSPGSDGEPALPAEARA